MRSLLLSSIILLIVFNQNVFSQPANDNCASAEEIIIPNNGFAIGSFTSAQFDLTDATVESGENFYSTISAAGQNDKTMWFRFSLPTARLCTLALKQTSPIITASDVGFTVYKANSCFPNSVQADSSLLTAQTILGQTYNPCFQPGDYLVQISAKSSADGPIYVELTLDTTSALYDFPTKAYDFDTLSGCYYSVDFPVGCLSIEDTSEVCPAVGTDFTQSAWMTFTTDDYFDNISVILSGGNSQYGGLISHNNFTVGYNLYRGDAKTSPINSLVLEDGCHSSTYQIRYQNPPLVWEYDCDDLQTNTTYSIQLFFNKYFTDDLVRVNIIQKGNAPGVSSPTPVLSTLPAAYDLGSIYSGTQTLSGNFSCDTRLETNACGTVNPAGGHIVGSDTFDLAEWYTFELQEYSNIYFSGNSNCGYPYMRIFKKGISAQCVDIIDSVDLYAVVRNYSDLLCVPAGNYSIQVMGENSRLQRYVRSYDCNCYNTNYGKDYSFTMTVNPSLSNNYDLAASGKIDTVSHVLGVLAPLKKDTFYYGRPDTFGCPKTVMPAGTTCGSNDRATYREFMIGDADNDGIADSGIIRIYGACQYSGSSRYPNYMENVFYRGDASALATAQNAFSYPDTISGLTRLSGCDYCMSNEYFCVTPGVYTHVIMGDSTHSGFVTEPRYRFNILKTKHYNAATSGFIDTIVSGTYYSDYDYFSCKDNAEPIDGYAPCTISSRPATKAIYREFYISRPGLYQFERYNSSTRGTMSVFSGRASEGLNTLQFVDNDWMCYNVYNRKSFCMDVGWYTIVAYGIGATYENNLWYNGRNNRGDLGSYNRITITTTPGRKYNRPHKAAVDPNTSNPYIVHPRLNPGTSIYPRTDTTINLATEYFDCTNDTPFITHPIIPCDSNTHTKVAYWVFELTEVSSVNISGLPYNRGEKAVIYPFDVRVDSNLLTSVAPVQPCVDPNSSFGVNGVNLCLMQPGFYTLVLFGDEDLEGRSFRPRINVDKVGYSRFDHALNAYDFGSVSGDNIWYNGMPGDTNPINPLWAPSNDFFYCTTGSRSTDPDLVDCDGRYNPNVYAGNTNVPMFDDSYPPIGYARIKRNLWYTFVLENAGQCTIVVNNKTSGRSTPRFQVFESDVDGSIPFSTVVANGWVDSTFNDGLTSVPNLSNSGRGYNYCRSSCRCNDNYTIFRDPCEEQIPTRYYIVLDNRYYNDINNQVDVSIKYDTISKPPVYYDHFSQANVVNGLNQIQPPYTNLPLDTSIVYGDWGDFTCATFDNTDPYSTSCSPKKSLWYKFTIAETGYLRWRLDDPNSRSPTMRIYREITPGDSITVDLQYTNYTSRPYVSGKYWYQRCVIPGTYYIYLYDCETLPFQVRPVLWFIDQVGDYCEDPVVGTLNSPGSITISAVIDCHTIGEGFGEDGTNMGCLIPPGGIINNYKTTWYRFDIAANDTFDITPVLTENTIVTANDIRYRLLYGNCSAMNTGSCFVTANTVNTFECLSEGSYYVQVISPARKTSWPYDPITGTIDITFNVVQSTPGCVTVNQCFVVAGFNFNASCQNDSVQFSNTSTSGDSIMYHWDFGYNGDSSSLKNPAYFYPNIDTAQTYTVTLTVSNPQCNEVDVETKTVTVLPRPTSNLGPDTAFCTPDGNISYLLSSPSHPGSIYRWQNNSSDTTYLVTGTGTYSLEVSLDTCVRTDDVQVTVGSETNVNLPANAVLCPGETVQLDISQGFSASYLWSTGSTSSSITIDTPGVYWGRAFTASGLCLDADTIEVRDISMADILDSDTIICPGSILTLDAGIPGATGYAWSIGDTTASIDLTQAGEYSVTITLGTCIISDTIIIGHFSVNDIEILYDTVWCGGVSTVLSLSDTGFVSYLWNTGDTLLQITVDTPMQYIVNAIDTNACVVSDSVVLSPVGNYTVDLTTNDILCYGEDNGNINSLINGGLAPYAYTWNTGDTSQNIANIGPGTYSLTVNDANSCSVTVSDTVFSPDSLDISLVSKTDVSCFSFSDGSIDISVSGGVLPYAYSWSGNQISEDITALIAGVYTVVVTDSNSCTDTLSVEILEPAQLSITQITALDVSCSEPDTGSVNIDISGGTLPYQYAWSNGDTIEDISGLSAGTYFVTVTDANNCVVSDSANVLYPTLPEITLDSFSNPNCFGSSDGALYISTANGLQPYAYQWNSGDSTEDIQNISAGVYTLEVTDANGCVDNFTDTLSEPTPLQLTYTSDNIGCFGGSDGEVDIIVTGGTPSYQYDWSNGSTTKDLSGVVAGTYIVTASDSNACVLIDTFILTEPDDLVIISDSSVNASCLAISDGEIYVSVIGGTTPYSYDWSNGSTAEDPTGLASGVYELTVTDSNNCTATFTDTVGADPDILIAAVVTDVNCYSMSNGSITTSLVNGESPYTYNWSTGASSQDLTGIAMGNYTLTVTDINGCQADTSMQVDEPAEMVFTSISTTDVSCNGFSDGAIMTSVTGGFAPYTYNWSNGNTTSQVDSLVAGTYTLTVIDSVACSIDTSITVDEPTPLQLTYTSENIGCFGGSDGAVDITVSGGTPAYQYNWSNGSTTEDLNGVVAGTYIVTVTDSNACVLIDTFTLTEPDDLVISSDSSVNASCLAISDGEIYVSVIGGTTPYSYDWSNGSTMEDPTGLASGVYSLTVTDSNNCTATFTDTVGADPDILIAAVVTDVNCYSMANGSITTSLVNGESPYTYNWSTGASSQDLTGIAMGNYSLTVTDVNGCQADTSMQVDEPAEMIFTSINTTDASCNGFSDGAITTSVTGGFTPYTYNWSNGNTTSQADSLVAGTYTLTVIDSVACSIDTSITVDEPTPLQLTYTSEHIGCFGGSDGAIDITVTGGTPAYQYNWNNTFTGEDLSDVQAGNYEVTVTDFNGCVLMTGFILSQSDSLSVSADIIAESCLGEMDGYIDISVSGGTEPYTYYWSNGEIVEDLSSVAGGFYDLTVSDSFNCNISASYYVNTIDSISVTAYTDTTLDYGESMQIVLDVISGSDVSNYTWTPEDGLSCNDCSQPIVEASYPTVYVITVENINGCIDLDSLTIDVLYTEEVLAPNAFTPNGDGVNDYFTLYNKNIESAKLYIFNRWGENIYETTELYPGWDGTYNGNICKAGVYVYYTELKFKGNRRTVTSKGSLTLIR